MDYPNQKELLRGLKDTDRTRLTKKAKRAQASIHANHARKWINHNTSMHGQRALKKLGKQIQQSAIGFVRWYFAETDRYTEGKLLSGNARKELCRAFHHRIVGWNKRRERQRKTDLIQGGVVYVIGNRDAGVCKIGMTSRPEKRFAQLQVGFPWELWVLRLFFGEASRFEHRLHSLFAEHNIRGEWFEMKLAVNEMLNGWEGMPLSKFSVEKWLDKYPDQRMLTEAVG